MAGTTQDAIDAWYAAQGGGEDVQPLPPFKLIPTCIRSSDKGVLCKAWFIYFWKHIFCFLGPKPHESYQLRTFCHVFKNALDAPLHARCSSAHLVQMCQRVSRAVPTPGFILLNNENKDDDALALALEVAVPCFTVTATSAGYHGG